MESEQPTQLKPCLFLDRDGVIIEDSGYPYKVSELRLIPEVLPLMRWAKERGWFILVMSNQAGVAHGRFSEKDLQLATDFLRDTLQKHGVAPDAWYYCMFHPNAKLKQYREDSNLRKPKPGLFLKAMQEHPIDLARSFMVGDKESDVIDLPGLRCLLLAGSYPLTAGKAPVFKTHAEILEYLKSHA